MSDVDKLVRETLSRHQAEVPTPEAGEVRSVAVRARRRQAMNAVGAGLVALVIALGAVTGVSALLRADGRRPAGPTSPTPPPSPSERVGFLGLPPEGALPSEPAIGELVLDFDGVDDLVEHDGDGHTTSLFVYADGRFIWQKIGCDARPACEPLDVPEGATKLETGWLEQRLTPQGVELLRSAILATGLFEHDLELKAGRVVSGFAADVWKGGRNVRVAAGSTLGFAPATVEQVRALRDLHAILIDPGAWLPANAWKDRTIDAFVPSRYRVLLDFAGVGNRTPEDPTVLPPAAKDLLRAADSADHFGSCQLVSTDQARQISHELATADGIDVFSPDRENSNGPISFAITGGSAPSGTFGVKGFVYLSPVLPHEVSC